MKKTNYWFWAFIVLLILNITAIGTMFYTHGNMQRNSIAAPNGQPPPPIKPPIKFTNLLKEKVGYTDEQIGILRQVRIEHMETMKEYKIQLKNVQHLLFDYVADENPNKANIDSMKQQISILHSMMIDESIAFYEKIRANSTPEQLDRLNRYYRESLFTDDRPFHGKQGQGRGYGRRFQNNP